MFKKQVDKKVEAPQPEVQPVKAEEISAPVDAEELVEQAEDEEVSEEVEEEMTEEQLKVILQKLVSDVNAIKYHLRLDFI